MLDASSSYSLISRDLTASLARTAKEPAVERASNDYLAAIETVETVDDFLANDKVYRYAMKAMGLEDMTYAKAFMRKVLTEGTDDPDAFANKLSDTRYKDFAETFNFARYGSTAMSFSRTQQGVVDKYVRQTLEETTGTQNEGARLALYFERKASSVENVYSILADPAILKVMQVAFSVPPETGAMNIDKQAAMFEKLIDIESLQDPEEVSALLKRFTALWDVNEAPAAAATPSLQLYGNAPSIDGDLLLTLQSYRSGF